MPDASLRPPAGIDAELLAELMEKVSEFGSTGDGGVDRPALTDAHKAARDWFATQMRARGYRVLVDRIGNLFGRIDLAGPDAPLVMIGSHLDSQPVGGRFDGTYGVVAALAAVDVPNPSETVRKYTGTPSVSEAAALLAAGADQTHLIIEKHKLRGPDGRNATVSIARIPQ